VLVGVIVSLLVAGAVGGVLVGLYWTRRQRRGTALGD
jgi:hypothetical protein